MSTTTANTSSTPLPTPAQLLEPLTATDPSTTTSTTTGTDDAVQAAVQGWTDHLLRRARAAAAAAAAQTQQTENTQEQEQGQGAGGSIGDFVWTAYNALLDAVERTPPARQGGLLEFVRRLRETVVKGEGADGGEVLSYEGGELWRGLPTLGWVVRDRWNFDSSDLKATAEQRAGWENLNAFVAQLTTRGDGDDPLDFTMFGLWVMRDAFEAENGVGSETAVRVAALWVKFAGPLLRELSSNGYDLSAKLGVAQGKYADRGWKGFNEERWKAWGGELKVAQAKLASDETVQGAAKAMEQL